MPPLRRILLTRAWLFAIAWGAFAYAFHAVGNASGMYVRHWWFQILAHYVSSTAVALLVARAGLELRLPYGRLVGFIVFFSAVGAVSWEVVEYLGIFPNLHFWGIQDSLLDLASDTAGVLTVLFALRTRLRPVVDPTAETPSLSSLVAGADSGRNRGGGPGRSDD